MSIAQINPGLLLFAVALPLLVAVGMARRGWRGGLTRLAPWAALPALAAVFVVPNGVESSSSWLFLGSRMGLDQTGRIFLLFTSGLWWLSGVFAQHYLVSDPGRARFFVFHLLAMSGNFGLILAQDMVTFYVGFSLMSFASYGLVIHNGESESLRAGRVYLCLVVLGELMLFAAIAMLATSASSILLRDIITQPMSNTTLALLVFGFGIKAGALPLHVWLPLAHPAAPVPASAVLSGAMIKAGLLGWIRFLPLGQAELPYWGALVIAAGLAASFYGALVGVTQTNPKTVLAYSSISQMGLITIPLGLALVMPPLWPTALTAILIYALHHALAKGALFLGVGVASHARTRAPRGGMFLGLLVPALALAGAPLTSGAIAKAALKAEIAWLPAPWPGLLTVALALAAVGSTLLMARFLWLIWSIPAPHGEGHFGLWGSWTVLLFGVAVVPWVLPIASDAGREAQKTANVWASLWPCGVGLFLAWLVLLLSQKIPARSSPLIPAGDVLSFVSWLTGRVAPRFRATATSGPAEQPATLSQPCGKLAGSRARLAQLEVKLQKWTVAGLALLGLMAVFYVLLKK